MVTTFLPSFVSIVDVMNTDSSATVGAAASSFAMCSLWGFPFAHNLALMFPSFFSFRNMRDDSAFLLSSSDRSFACCS
jgi:hypothetical protein